MLNDANQRLEKQGSAGESQSLSVWSLKVNDLPRCCSIFCLLRTYLCSDSFIGKLEAFTALNCPYVLSTYITNQRR